MVTKQLNDILTNPFWTLLLVDSKTKYRIDHFIFFNLFIIIILYSTMCKWPPLNWSAGHTGVTNTSKMWLIYRLGYYEFIQLWSFQLSLIVSELWVFARARLTWTIHLSHSALDWRRLLHNSLASLLLVVEKSAQDLYHVTFLHLSCRLIRFGIKPKAKKLWARN